MTRRRGDEDGSRTVRLTKPLEEALRGGHPWLFADAVALAPGLRDGEVVDLLDRRGGFLARGTVEPRSPLAFRAWTLAQDEAVDEKLVERRLAEALALRRAILRADLTGFRVCHGESDRIPGLQCDLYGDVASLRTDGDLGAAWESRFVAAVAKVVAPRAIVVRNVKVDEGAARIVAGRIDGQGAEGGAGRGAGEVEIVEHGRRFLVDVLAGQKTGFFLDQRENRDRVGAIARGRDVLNLFGYTGGFSVAAALGGARRVTTLDLAAPAVAVARRNFVLNGLDPAAHEFVVRDAFDTLAELAQAPPRHDLIVLDPPSFAPNKRSVARAVKAYEKLNELTLRALPPGGWLATASCSSHVREADFLSILATAASRARRELAIAGLFGAGPDHPIRLGFPEGRYLKFVLARAL
jgi:23S rRNA (cytosine1962-C5)-methyltransferase